MTRLEPAPGEGVAHERLAGELAAPSVDPLAVTEPFLGTRGYGARLELPHVAEARRTRPQREPRPEIVLGDQPHVLPHVGEHLAHEVRVVERLRRILLVQ